MRENSSPSPWIGYMRKGNFEKAWNFSDTVLKSGINRDYNNTPRHFQLIWDGTPPDGKRVLVRCYHGLGDTIQFIRYARLLKRIASQVIVWSQPDLISLLKTAEGIDRLLPLHDGKPEADYDVDVEIMELPHIFRTNLSTIPSRVPYLHVEPMKFQKDSNIISVGLVWQSGDWDLTRNVPFELLKPLTALENIHTFILQAEAVSAGWQPGYGIYPGDFDLFDYARIIKELDLLITVDSMPAHLAGAMNVPVWLMLSADPDWRWMENRPESPWYPSMKIFRQEKQGDWAPVIEKVLAELKKFVV